jgi:hypothetical protein
MIDDQAKKIIEEALEKPDADAGISHMIENIDKLPEDVRAQLTLSVLGNAFQDEADRMNRATDALESIVEAIKTEDSKTAA